MTRYIIRPVRFGHFIYIPETRTFFMYGLFQAHPEDVITFHNKIGRPMDIGV